MKYEFSLILVEADVTEGQADELFEAGCDDGSILSRGEISMIQFNSQADTLDIAIASAIRDVEKAGFQVARVEIERHEVPQAV